MLVRASWLQHLWVQGSLFGFCISHGYRLASLETKVTFVLCHTQCVTCCDWCLNAGHECRPDATGCCGIFWFTHLFLRTLNMCIGNVWQSICRAVIPAVRLHLSPMRPGFDPRSVHVRFVVGKSALGHVLPLVLRFSPPVLHTLIPVHLQELKTAYTAKVYVKQLLLPAASRG